ncbi:U-box domain-containing protein 10 [Acorus gramineus]|uniref:RING-type E3 ubiquitin transferase n=1 Tax=Acorus gramineus TaxID=55184 RepID=A0AAV9AGW7_ACOGR|nr:U-box domain-containing protein 10 [Acorus gramineus]
MASVRGDALLGVVGEVVAVAVFADAVRRDCVGLSRKVALLSHLFEEVSEFSGSSSSIGLVHRGCLSDVLLALEVAKRLLLLGRRDRTPPLDVSRENFAIKFQFVAWQLEKVLGNLSYDYFNISDEVREQVDLVRTQLKRAIERNGVPNTKVFAEIHRVLSYTYDGEGGLPSSSHAGETQIDNKGDIDFNLREMVFIVASITGKTGDELLQRLRKSSSSDPFKTDKTNAKSRNIVNTSSEEIKKPDLAIPEDFRCPISLELMRDPVIVATGQTYERSFIQRWIDCGNHTCPKTQQKLQNLTLTPNYVLRSLIAQWCVANLIEQPLGLANGRLRRSNGSYLEDEGDRSAIEELVRNLSFGSSDTQRSAAAEIRSLAKRSTENRILIAEAGAIPALVSLLSSPDTKTQEHAVTCILNLSIYENNKESIMLAGAMSPIIQVLKAGSMEARENAAAAIFSLSLVDEYKITIGGTPGVIDALVDLLEHGSARGKKDAATALFNLCIYPGNKGRAVRAGILGPLVKMLVDLSMVDEALTILSVLVSHQESKVAIAKANTIPILIDLIRAGQPRNKENAAAVLLALCKKNEENLACIGRLGAVIPLTELVRSGTDRAKRKATSLLEHLKRLHKV